MAAKQPNYTEEQTQAIIADYQAGKTVEEIAEATSRAVRSVRAKLVREGVYVAQEKPVKAPKEEGPTKKEMLIELDSLVKAYDLPMKTDGLMQATKEAIQSVIDTIRAMAIDPEAELGSDSEGEADAA